MLDPVATAVGERVFDVRVTRQQDARTDEALADQRVDIYQCVGGRNRILRLSYPIELAQPGAIQVTLAPVKGKALVCGAVLTPVHQHDKDQLE